VPCRPFTVPMAIDDRLNSPSAYGMRSPLLDWSQPSSGSVSFVTAPDVFRDQPVLTGDLVRLEPLTQAVLEDYLAALAEPEVRRFTGAHVRFDRPKIEAWLATRGEHHDRADWAVVRAEDGAFLGEAVLNEVDLENESADYRVWLAGPQVFGQGYGTEITRLVVEYALGTCGLHRVSSGGRRERGSPPRSAATRALARGPGATASPDRAPVPARRLGCATVHVRHVAFSVARPGSGRG
jgi:RimJ/RimL family protein N-acetyltransferase